MLSFKELRKRKIFQVAGVYAVVAWLLVQIVVTVEAPLGLPDWVDSLVIVLLAIGFPICLILAWIFDFGPEGVTRTTPGDTSPRAAGRGLEFALLGLIVVGIGWLVLRDSLTTSPGPSAARGVPVVVIMDTTAPRGVYDQETRDASGTNADVLNVLLRDLPIEIHKETIGATWDREDQILKQAPALVLIHRSGFFHAMNLEFGFGYGDDSPDFDETRWKRLYAVADNKLQAFLGYLGRSSPDTKFLVYSRGSGGDWRDDSVRAEWESQVVGRFPFLEGRLTTLWVPGGVAAGSLRDESTGRLFHQQVAELLGIDDDARSAAK